MQIICDCFPQSPLKKQKKRTHGNISFGLAAAPPHGNIPLVLGPRPLMAIFPSALRPRPLTEIFNPKEVEGRGKPDAREVGQVAVEAITRGSGQGKECYEEIKVQQV